MSTELGEGKKTSSHEEEDVFGSKAEEGEIQVCAWTEVECIDSHNTS